MATDLTNLIGVIQQQNQVLTSILAALKAQIAPLAVDYTHINTAATTVVRASAGYAVGINVNSVSGASSGATIYDAASAAAIAGSLVVGVPTWTASTQPQYLSLGPTGDGLSVNNGIVIVTTGTLDITVASRAK